jgi:hypothetical protein
VNRRPPSRLAALALAGRVYSGMGASYGEVSPGDLLITSPTCGYAMVVEHPCRAQGAILGEAMEGLGQGRKGANSHPGDLAVRQERVR